MRRRLLKKHRKLPCCIHNEHLRASFTGDAETAANQFDDAVIPDKSVKKALPTST